jgi:hypothetical protein
MMRSLRPDEARVTPTGESAQLGGELRARVGALEVTGAAAGHPSR